MPVGKRRTRDIDKGSEFGGVDGLIQPSPHEPTAREQLIAIHQRFVQPPENTTEREWEEVPGDMRNDLLPASTDQYKGISSMGDEVQQLLNAYFDGVSSVEDPEGFLLEVKTAFRKTINRLESKRDDGQA